MTAKEYTALIGARFTKADTELIESFCLARGESVSSFLRRLVRRELAMHNYYSEAEKKAFGIAEGSP